MARVVICEFMDERAVAQLEAAHDVLYDPQLVGTSARLLAEVAAGTTWEGEVVRISDWIEKRRSQQFEPLQFNDVRTLDVIIRMKSEPGYPMRIGQRVRVMLER